MKTKVFRIIAVASAIAFLGLFLQARLVMGAPLLQVNPTSGPPGTPITISGSGFIGSGATLVTINSSLGNAFAFINSGNFVATLMAPSMMPANFYTIIATDNAATPDTATVSFKITGALSLNKTSGFVGDQVQVQGAGFTASSTISFHWDSNSVPIATTQSDDTGSFTNVTVIVPVGAKGLHYVIASDSNSNSAQTTFIINPKISLNKVSANVGDSIVVIGSGFTSGSIITLQIDNQVGTTYTTTPSTISCDSMGGFNASLIIPTLSQGSHTIGATDTSADSATASFSIGQKILIVPSSGSAGDKITVNGSGFSDEETITLALDNIPLTGVNPSFAVTQSGSFTATFIIPVTPGGLHKLTATDLDSHVASSMLTVSPKLSLSPASGIINSQITLSGNGFAAAANLTISFDSLNVGTAQTDNRGSFSDFVFNVPASTNGSHSVIVHDSSNNQATQSFITKSSISIDNSSAYYGDIITMNGMGYAANSNIITKIGIYSLSGVLLPFGTTSITSDASGSFNAQFTVPSVPIGIMLISATDAANNHAEINFTVKSKIITNIVNGTAGDQVAISGYGFNLNQRIAIKFGGSTIATTPASVNTDGFGSFSTVFAVPVIAAGDYSIDACDDNNSASTKFTVSAGVNISNATTESAPGYVGMGVTISGSAFTPNSTITVTYSTSSSPSTVATITCNSCGFFSVAFKVPPSSSGNHTITVSDGIITKTFPFIMESTPPPAPSLLNPVDRADCTQPFCFSWTGVSDPSGITYELQISHDATFASPTLYEKGIMGTDYGLTTAENLVATGGSNPYYWRVRAVDLAGNASDWAQARIFTASTVGTIDTVDTGGFTWPHWILYLWFGLAALFAFILGLLVRRNNSNRLI